MNLLDFAQPWWLLGLPLCLLPLLRRRSDEQVFPWIGWLPQDRRAVWRQRAEKGAAMLAIAAVFLGLAGIGTPETTVSRIGSGAEIVVLLDRSASMDAALVPLGQMPGTDKNQEPKKRKIARRALAEFAANRPNDVFALMMFSATPFQVMPFNGQPDMIQAAIQAGGVGSGLGATDVGRALIAATRMFDDRPVIGSRIILLVSDGGAPLTPDAREAIKENLKRNNISLYWIYLRSFNQPPLAESADPQFDGSIEVRMHRFFTSLRTPYKAFEAESPEGMTKAIQTLGQQQLMPITYEERVPRVDRSVWLYALAAMACIALLLLRSRHILLRRSST